MPKKKGLNIIGFVLILLISIIAILPFYTMLIMGTYYTNDLFTGMKFIPGNYLGENIKTLFSIDILAFYKNSIIVAGGSAILTVVVCAMAGFAFAKYKFLFKKTLFSSVMVTMMIPMQLGLVAFVIEMQAIGWRNSLLPLIIPPAASAFGVFWMTQFASSAIPDEVMESARIDGCNEFTLFVKIALPFMRAACMTLALLAFLWSWNNLLTPLVVISNESLYTIPLGIRQLSTTFRNDTAAQVLGLSLTTLPILLLFSAFSKSLISGLSAAAVKG